MENKEKWFGKLKIALFVSILCFTLFACKNKNTQENASSSNTTATESDQNSIGLAVGQTAPDIVLNDPSGKTIPLSSLRGKYVLIDFWASWCGPCRYENPNVVRLYNQYKNKNFEIYSVSLDRDKANWEQAIAQDGLTWTHVSDLKFWNSSVVPLYKIEGIPMTLFLSPKGVILERDIRGKSLEETLEKYLK